MRESEHQARILLAIGATPGCRVFRNHVGEGWHGQVERQTPGLVLLRNPRRVSFGLAPGSADIIGWRAVTVTPDMVGRTVALFAALEVKTATGRASEAQRRFLAAVGSAGGLAGVVRSPADAESLLRLNDTS